MNVSAAQASLAPTVRNRTHATLVPARTMASAWTYLKDMKDPLSSVYVLMVWAVISSKRIHHSY